MPAKIFFVIEFDRFCHRVLPTTVSGSVTMRLKSRHRRIVGFSKIPMCLQATLSSNPKNKTTKPILIRSHTFFRALCQLQLSAILSLIGDRPELLPYCWFNEMHCMSLALISSTGSWMFLSLIMLV